MIRMPAEWEPQRAVWIAWPHDLFWLGYCMKLEGTYLRLVELMKTSQIVVIVVPNQQYQDHVEQQLIFHGIGLKNIEFYIIPTNDIWIRDYGPTFLINNGCLEAVKWQFNGYGKRFPHDFNLDDVAGAKIAESIEIPFVAVPLVLEGDNIDSDGAGTIMLCQSAVIDSERNPGLTRREATRILKRCLGARRIIWLSGLATKDIEATGWSDDTDTHVDTISRRTTPNRVVASWTDDRSEPAYKLLQKTHRELEKKGLEIVKLPVVKGGFYSISSIGAGGGISTGKIVRTDASYTNFVICNSIVVVPAYGRPEDEIARAILREQFPGRDVISLFAGHLAENGGEFHCNTKEEPKVI